MENINKRQSNETYSYQIQSDQQLIQQQTLEVQDNHQKVYLILGDTGEGKSSFIQKNTGDTRAEIGHGKESHTQLCYQFEKDGQKYIDSPGINDTKVNRYEILLRIAIYLYNQEYTPENLFIIYVQNRNLKTYKKTLQEFSFTYFLCELFKTQINGKEIEQFILEYNQTNGLLNWQECGLHQRNDEYSEKREKIFQQRDLAQKYLQLFDSYHIIVKTFFDKTDESELEIFDENMVNFLKEQIWSNVIENQNFGQYQKYIQDQKLYLFKKIEQIIQLQKRNETWQEGQQIQYLLLIGKSQVGKSSLIEQITSLKGLRGNGQQSETVLCQMFEKQLNDDRYFFIDTPGFGGTEIGQDEFHNLKIISDYLRRNKIKEFKILYVRDADKDIRDGMDRILNQLFIFIKYMLDQDMSFVDNNYLNEICQQYNQNNSQNYEINFIKEKVIQIDRVSSQVKVQKMDNPQKVVQFKTNFFNKYGRLIKVDEDEDLIQKENLFNAINNIDSISIEDTILLKIKQLSQVQLIDNPQQYKIAYQKIKQEYIKLNSILEKIALVGQQQNKEEIKKLNAEKLQIHIYLKSQQYLFFCEIPLEKEDQDIKPQQIDQIQNQLQFKINQNKLQNDIEKHFISIKWSPILFEAESNSKNILLSRKQLYFCQYYHFLKPFIQAGNQKHKQIIEVLAKIKILQECSLKHFIQQKQIEMNYNENSDQLIKSIGLIFSLINKFIGNGIQVYKADTMFIQIIFQALEKIFGQKRETGIFLTFSNIIKDISLQREGLISSKKLALCLLLNATSIAFSIGIYLNPQLIEFQGTLETLRQFGMQIINSKFTSYQTFDRSIGLFFKTIIDDMYPNQSLLYFQKSEVLRDNFQLQNYSQLNQKVGYEMYRKLEKNNFDNINQQTKILSNLFNCSEALIDKISQYITKNYILNYFTLNEKQQQQSLSKLEKKDHLDYLQKIVQSFVRTDLIIKTYYNKFDKTKIENFTKAQQEVQQIFLKSENAQKFTSNQHNITMIFTEQEENIITHYINELDTFVNLIKNQKYTYKQQIDLGDGSHRILLNSYCNLIQLKVEKIYEQEIISELQKDKKLTSFKVKPDVIIQDNFFSMGEGEQIVDQLNILYKSDQFIVNRYLQKTQMQQEPTLSSISESEILDYQLDYSIDLYDLTTDTHNFYDFIFKIKCKTKEIQKELQISSDLNKRLFNFYNSTIFLKKIFN